MRERIHSRRKILFGSAFAGATLLGADQFLKDGFILRAPDLTPQPKRINLNPREENLDQNVSVDLEQGVRPLRINEKTYVYYNSNDDLIFQHNGAAFVPRKRYLVSHRAGNMRKRVDTALELGASGIDIDVISQPEGEILASHTPAIKKIGIGPYVVGGSFDVTEIGMRTRISRSAVDMINYIGSKSNPEDPLIVTMELKSKSFSNKQAVKNLVAAISDNGLPTWVFSAHQQATDNFYEACEEYANGSRLIF